VKSITFSPDNQTALAGLSDGSLRLWNVNNGAEVRRFQAHTDWVQSVAFSADGKSILSASSDKSIVLWNIFHPLNELLIWTYNNRYIRELNCDERDLYGVKPFCDATNTIPTHNPVVTTLPLDGTDDPVSARTPIIVP
jgi:WD40 repeat protein